VGASGPIIGDDDHYEKSISIGSSDVFNWTVYKNSSTNYVVTVHLAGLEGWNTKNRSRVLCS